MKLLRKTALITGGAKGIGEAVARLFAEEGANVAIADFDDAAGERTAQEIRTKGGNAIFIHCDVSDPAEEQNSLRRTVETFGTIDILVNDAATQLNKPLLETSDEEFDQVIATNLKSTFMFTRDAAKLMIAHKHGGSIVNFSSTFALVGSPGYLAYHASKGGIASLTRAAAIALMPYGIRVNAVAPGTTLTPGLHDGADGTGNHDKAMESFLSLQPLKRFGKPEEIAKVVLFLASDDSSFVYGANVVSDGGYTII